MGKHSRIVNRESNRQKRASGQRGPIDPRCSMRRCGLPHVFGSIERNLTLGTVTVRCSWCFKAKP
jgi:hypothetical protein